MKKDTIYIDTEDDITSIIDKVKKSDEKIVALVPPKRPGVLQSAVNLKLLHKAASHQDKRIVLITASAALASLAAGAAIPVAKTLQSRPELASSPDAPNASEEDVINGEELPIGELQKTAAASAPSTKEDEIVLPEDMPIAQTAKKTAFAKKTKKSAVPNFDVFRKKLFLIIAGGILFLCFLVWAIFFAPHATVNIKAKTTAEKINQAVTLKNDIPTGVDNKNIQPITQQEKKSQTTTFAATGKKDVGEKATGTVKVTRTSISSNKISIPVGTGFSSGNFTFTTTEPAELKGTSIGPGGLVQDSTTIRVQAAAVGEEYNLSAREYEPTVSGVSAQGSQMSGGSKKQITVVSEQDVATAKTKLAEQDQNNIKLSLAKKFTSSDVVIISDSFTVSPSEPAVNPAVSAEATTGQAQMTLETTYSLLALKKKDVSALLDAALKNKIKRNSSQQIYDNGIKKIKLTQYNASATSVQLSTTGYTGPKVDSKQLKPQLVGKNYEEIRQIITRIDGIDDVDTTFSPFWVSRAPGEDKIEIVFDVSKQ